MPEMVEATIEGVQFDMDTQWYRVKTSKGRFDTKIAEKGEEANDLKGETVRLFFTTGQASGRTNPHTGQPYPPSRYYERAERVGPSVNGGGGIEQVSSRRGDDRDTTWRICLSVGVKAAVDTLPLMPVEQRDFQTQQQIALAWGKFLYFTKAPELGASQPQSLANPPDPEQGFRPFAGEDRPGAYDEPPPHTDSEIPY